MKKTILSIAVIAATVFTASCQKENLQGNTTSEGNASVFTATIENGASTKTTVERIGGNPAIYKTYWESTDQISIDGSIYTATPDDTDKTKATFNKTSGADPTAPFRAYFPASMYSDSKATLPASYTYADGKYNMPMYAQSESSNLSFKNLCGVLVIKVYYSVFSQIKSIEVSSDQQMNGEFTATADGVLTFASKTLTAADKKVTLTFASAKAIASNGSATFYIPVPAGTHKPLTIKVSDETTTKTMVTKKTVGVTITRNTVYPITFADNSNDPGYVEMKMGSTGTSKLIWATKNLGAISIASCGETCFGDYYAWGETEPHYTTRSWNKSGKQCTFDNWNSGKTGGYVWDSYWGNGSLATWTKDHTLSNDRDVVQLKLGDGWRMPTAKDFRDLCKACGINVEDDNPTFNFTPSSNGGKSTTAKGVYWCDNYDGIKGVLFIAEDNGKHLFFPAAGAINGTAHVNSESTSYYWSNTYFQTSNDKPNSIALQISKSKIYPNAHSIIGWLGFPIRPVKDVPTTE